MFQVEETPKVNQSSSGATTEKLTRDGESSILTKLRRSKIRDFTRIPDSTSTDHSTSDQDFHSRESLRCTETDTSTLEDGSRTERDNSGSSI